MDFGEKSMSGTVTWDELRKGMKELMKEELKGWAPQSQQQPELPTESHAQHILSCPNCFAETVKGIEKMKETSDYLCEDCDLPLGSKEFAEKIDACPRCGSKKAKKR